VPEHHWQRAHADEVLGNVEGQHQQQQQPPMQVQGDIVAATAVAAMQRRP
jgi:hypothetical protein